MWALLQAEAGRAPVALGYGASLLQALLALAAVSILAWVVLKWSADRRFFGALSGRGRVRVLERVHLEPRRTLYLIEVGKKVLLVGAGESGAPAVLCEVAPTDLPAGALEPAARRFGDVLKGLRGTVTEPPSTPAAAPSEPAGPPRE